MRIRLALLVGLLVAAGASRAGAADPFPSYEAFRAELLRVTSLDEAAPRKRAVDALWQRLRELGQIPYRDGDRVALLYLDRSAGVREVAWRGDVTGWDLVGTHIGRRLGDSRVWWVEDVLPVDARVDYRIVLDGTEWIVDPDNPHRQVGSYGPNSELRMPEWSPPPEIETRSGIARGRLGAHERLTSEIVDGYTVTYRVYKPADYLSGGGPYPVVYVADGHEYSDPEMGRMTEILDNRIADGALPPLLAVFLDPRNPADDENRRRWEYADHSDLYSRILVEEIVPAVDGKYRSRPEPRSRVIVGASYGGLFAAHVALYHDETFGGALIQSPAFEYDEYVLDRRLITAFEGESGGKVRLFLDVGTMHDDLARSREFRDLARAGGYPVRWVEVHDGHSWGHWRAWLDDGLRFCLGSD